MLVLSLFLFLLLRTNMERNTLLLLLTAFPWGETVNPLAVCAAITVPSASVGSSELSVTAEWATLTARRGGAARSSSEQNRMKRHVNHL